MKLFLFIHIFTTTVKIMTGRAVSDFMHGSSSSLVACSIIYNEITVLNIASKSTGSSSKRQDGKYRLGKHVMGFENKPTPPPFHYPIPYTLFNPDFNTNSDGPDGATAATDFDIVSTTLVFAPNEPTKTFMLVTRDDAVVEDPERFRVTITSSDDVVDPDRYDLIICIVDNDCKWCH